MTPEGCQDGFRPGICLQAQTGQGSGGWTSIAQLRTLMSCSPGDLGSTHHLSPKSLGNGVQDQGAPRDGDEDCDDAFSPFSWSLTVYI